MSNNNILQYESKIWATADLLRGCGIKESEWPSFMMPFFALVMIESRLLRMLDKLKAEYGADVFARITQEEFSELIYDQNQGYNIYIFEKNQTLKDICKNDKSFDIDFDAYLKGFDAETKDLLGVETGEGEKYLDIKGVITKLKNKKVLLGYTKEWSEIDLKPFNNSEITTLEEHIKRRWADISAETAGEQYTPDDVIALISEIIATKIEESDRLLKIYDCTCGGGNLLFGVEDRINEKGHRYTQTFGQDWNDALYALAKIESRFRKDSKIEHGNTLTSDKFYDDEFDVVVANPPYGVSWKGYQKDINNDKTQRFKYLPSVSDGQLLFMQHLISKLDSNGVGVVVHNGSTLFSGDAGSAESNIRKWMLDTDIVEAVIQLPTDEFFNTGIYTYLWVLNKNKDARHQDRVMLINASEKYKLLKKSKGKKRREVDEANRLEIVETLSKFIDNDYARVFNKEFFYFNKQAIQLTNIDENGKSFVSQLKEGKSSLKLKPLKLENGERILTEFTILSDSSSLGEFAPQPSSLKEFAPQPSSLGESAPQPPSLGENVPQPSSLGESDPQPSSLAESAPQPSSLGEFAPQPPILGEFAPQPPSLGENVPQPPTLGEQDRLKSPEFGGFRGLKEVHEEDIKPFISSLDYKEQPLKEFAPQPPTLGEQDRLKSPEFGGFRGLKEVHEEDIKPFISSLDYKEQPLVVTTAKARYWFDSDKETLIKETLGESAPQPPSLGEKEELGCGKIVIKSSYKKKTKTRPEQIVITVELTPDYQKDYEIIPYHRDEAANKQAIADFMAQYITKPFEYLDNVVGVEINFNKVFYKPEKLRDVAEILEDIASLDEELKKLEEELIIEN